MDPRSAAVSAGRALGNLVRNSGQRIRDVCSAYLRYVLDQRSASPVEEENMAIVRAPQVRLESLAESGLPFGADDIRDAVTIAADSKSPDVAQAGFIAGVPRGNARSRYVLVGSQAHLERYTSEDGHRKVNAFLDRLGQTQTFFFDRDGMVGTTSGLQATVAYNGQLGKMCIYFAGTDLLDPHRRLQSLCADVGIVSGSISPMFTEAVELVRLAVLVFGRDSVMLCGHSLGGSIVQFVSASIGIPGIAMNSAPINQSWILDLPSEKLRYAQKNGCQVSVEGDIFDSASRFASYMGLGCIQLFKKTI
ncbi:MAG: hypothetical protein LBD33_02450, partial [Puniceicoccales bacterium]|nr:hypothetical protein [Puniceicoccales bacterium]